ncbi:NTF2-like protein [Schizopora paradoxa]|uniref:NTF2-like protein n=1 Tax=Schizopora paradoxa TaxID=27342 RepID=A0A0H2RSD9_9AGAM|nr:NTF2-like protein [Schizopora paradoxa]
MTSQNIKVFHNIVESVSQAPYLVLLCPESATEWCSQFAQEGYNVLQIPYPASLDAQSLKNIQHEIAQHSKKGFGLITFGLLEKDVDTLSAFCKSSAQLRVAIHYCPLVETAGLLGTSKELQTAKIKYMFHLAAAQETLHASLLPAFEETVEFPVVDVHTYPLVPVSPPFPLLSRAPVSVVPGQSLTAINAHILSATNVAYSKSLALLRREIGPHFNLEKIWGEHIRYEFEERNALKTIQTMVQVPYVNHIPTMTGGVGKDDLTRFYKHHFTSESVTPPDTEMITVSRTIGSDRIIDEMIFKATHTCEIDYLLPGIKPTGKAFEIALVGVIAFRGDKLCFEHIYWDQASLLVQLGLIPEKGLPVAGKESAQKVLDPFGMASNTLMERWKESEGLSVE